MTLWQRVYGLADGASAPVGLGYGAHGQAVEPSAAEIISAGAKAIAIGADLRRPEAPGELVQAAEALGLQEVVVSNAGLSRVQLLVADWSGRRRRAEEAIADGQATVGVL